MSRFLVPAAVFLELLALCLSSIKVSAFAGVLFVLYFTLALRRLQSYSRYLFLISLVVIGYLGVIRQLTAEDLMRAASNAAFYAAFLGSLGMMQCLVRRLEVLQRIHDVLLGGRPALLYPKYAVVSCGIASVLNFGVMNLLWIGLIAAFVLAEKALPKGEIVARVAGVILMLVGIGVVARHVLGA